MNAQDLIEILQDFPPDTRIILSRDSEGNGFAPICDFSVGTVRPDEYGNARITEFYDNHSTDENCGLEKGERDNFVKVVLFWPV